MKSKLLVILGSTSTGKTDLGIELAKKLNGELISADSRQVYKYLDIGTGKLPSQNAKRKMQIEISKGFWIINEIKIWMYDITLPAQRYNLYKYILDAQEIIKRVIDEGKLPILVGGTGLYIRSLLKGVSDFGIFEDTGLRSELSNLEIEEIRNKITAANPQALKKLNNSEINNKRRLIRVYEKLISPDESETPFPGIEKGLNTLKIGLKTDRKILRERIKQRVISRIEKGMIAESKNLLANGILTYERMEELGLEYKYLAMFLKGDINSKEDLIEILSLKIGQFAKRQETWFRKESDVNWFDIAKPGYIKQVETFASNWYNNN